LPEIYHPWLQFGSFATILSPAATNIAFIITALYNFKEYNLFVGNNINISEKHGRIQVFFFHFT